MDGWLVSWTVNPVAEVGLLDATGGRAVSFMSTVHWMQQGGGLSLSRPLYRLLSACLDFVCVL